MNNKMYKNIDQLIADGKKEEACIFIEEVWKKREGANQEKIAKLILRVEKQEWCFRTKNKRTAASCGNSIHPKIDSK